jgi:glycosyltransferase involved in cell wall biosynthesis
MSPRVSVLVNTYNHEAYIAQALQSVLDQDFPPDQMEIIVVDDGSTDSTPEIIRPFLPRIRYIRKQNGGQVSAFNVAVAEACGEIIAFLDGDDYWAPSKISSILNTFERNPGIACVGHAYHEVDADGRIIATMLPTTDRVTLKDASLAQSSSLLGVFLGTSRLSIRRSILEKTLPVPPELPFFDTFVYSQAVAISGAVLLPQPLCYYRLHASNLYASSSPEKSVLWTRYSLLSGLLTHLAPRLLSLGVPAATVDEFFSASRQDADRLRLKLQGGKRAETFRVERAAFRLAYRNPDFGYRLFNSFVLFLTLLLPPRTFYRLRDWYARKNIGRARRLIGDAEPVQPQTFTDRRPAILPTSQPQ